MRLIYKLITFALVLSQVSTLSSAERVSDRLPRQIASFGLLTAPVASVVRDQAAAWLQSAGKTDAASRQVFEKIWRNDRSILDKLADTFILGDALSAKLLKDARDLSAEPPTNVPDVLKDTWLSLFYRANLALAYAKALSNRMVFEEGLATLKLFKAEDTLDPAAFLFTKAVAEHALMMRPAAEKSISRLLEDVADAPVRYSAIAVLMRTDILEWKEKDLGWVARKMDNIQRRLDLARGGPKTRKMQKQVLARLDEMIKQMEQKQGSQNPRPAASSKRCPIGPPAHMNENRPDKPAPDSKLGGLRGTGQVDPKKLQELTKVWGNLPEKERAKALVGLTRNLDPRYRRTIEKYFQKLSVASPENK